MAAMRAEAWVGLFGVLLVVFGVIVGVVLPPSPAARATPATPDGLELDDSSASRCMVAADQGPCSQVGVDIMVKGGNAVDAAVATGLCQGLLGSYASGIGGGGFIIVRNVSGEVTTIDMREVAPLEFPDFFGQKTVPRQGVIMTGVPGELKGYDMVHRKFGVLPWKDVVRPALLLARDGFPVPKTMKVRIDSFAKSINPNRDYGILKDTLLPGGKALEEGEILKLPAIAATLQKISDQGVSVFYEGEVGAAFVRDIRSAGGVLTEADLKDYRAVSHTALNTSLAGGYTVHSVPPPSCGGVVALVLCTVDAFYEKVDPSTLTEVQKLHVFIEAVKLGFSLRTRLGDPLFVPGIEKVVGGMTDPDMCVFGADMITLNSTHPPEYYHPMADVLDDHGTSHFSVVDRAGSAVGVTTTVNWSWGSMYMSPSTGIIANNQLDDFSLTKDANGFGLASSRPNYPQPFKRPLSSMSPVVLTRDGKFYAVAGASGGPLIITSVLQALMNVRTNGMMAQEAVNAPRFHSQLLPDILLLEDKIPQEIREGLAGLGHKLQDQGQLADGQLGGVVQLIAVSPHGGLMAASDPRKGGAPASC